ncbi:DUF523 domain-containing protein [Actinomadura parmotrematis]|uniref:DUF523 domain-containing protein n=1 Tax=Actinomadura parmotrematis TaxID=2864039 RepID=A0ABS7G7J1_9ACTN|nr:DUF523 domain-containing protein [Actinomadura parmotrematis]MBW8487598.1 DUF523 domain-containing protein [Actinomadura parmotrematis]
MEPILVSSCLLGRPVRYDGTGRPVADAVVEAWRAAGRLVPVCPEVAGGLAVPRPPAEIVGGTGADVLDGAARVVAVTGEDVTEAFLRGARHALDAARRTGARVAVLKQGSPSCGTLRVHDGTFSGRKVPGEGVTAALLERAGVRVFGEDDLAAAAAYADSL